jgi:beta-phosphoglucomutase-like phosphatase (HAD superfamily)
LQRAQLSDYFHVIADGYTVERSKPAPDLFIWVAGALGAAPHDCIIFEDSKAGIEAAHTIGAYVVGIGDSEHVVNAHSHYLDLGQVDLAQLLQHASHDRSAHPILDQSSLK